MLLDGFRQHRIATSGAEINVRTAGDGPPLLLLHGYPQTHAMWHRVAPILAEQFTVVCPDLRGYGASSKPASHATHATYSKRAIAQDMAEVMTALGHETFQLAGHDRGGRVAHRLAVDHAPRVRKLALLDIIPTFDVFAEVDQKVATGTYHWFFLIQPEPLPERLIAAEPEFFLRWHLRSWSAGRDEFFAPEAVAAYIEAFRDPAVIHATCEDYRAGASIDLEHDAADRAAGRRIQCPLLVLWGANGKPQDVAAHWRPLCDAQVTGLPLSAGHFLAEEVPAETAAALAEFFAA